MSADNGGGNGLWGNGPVPLKDGPAKAGNPGDRGAPKAAGAGRGADGTVIAPSTRPAGGPSLYGKLQ
ncbi:MAG: hypothetical protein ABSE77_21195, partial [Acidimicrobiales bacterium]